MTEQFPSVVDALLRASERLESLGVSKIQIVSMADLIMRGFVIVVCDKTRVVYAWHERCTVAVVNEELGI